MDKKTLTRKANELCKNAGVSGATAKEMAANIVFMADRLNAARGLAMNSNLVVPYDNGGGQRGIRENPIFSAYEKLVRTYAKLVSEFEALAVKQGGSLLKIQDAMPKNVTPLAEMQKRFGDQKSKKKITNIG